MSWELKLGSASWTTTRAISRSESFEKQASNIASGHLNNKPFTIFWQLQHSQTLVGEEVNSYDLQGLKIAISFNYRWALS